MKKYIKITNLSSFPEFQGVRVDEGNLHRSYCQCGFVICDSIGKCPQCGNEEWQDFPRVTESYEIRSERLDLRAVLVRHRTHIVKNDREETYIETTASDAYSASMSDCNVSRLINDPLIERIPKYKVARDITRSYFDEDAYESSAYCSMWLPAARFTELIFSQGLQHQRKYEYLREWFDFFRDYNSVNYFINNCKVSKRTNDASLWLEKFELLPAHIQQVCRDGQIVNYFNVDNIDRIGEIPTKILDVVSAYYMCGYIDSLAWLIKALVDEGITEKNADAFVKFFKEKYANLSYVGVFLQWLNQGNEFISVKDYYLQQNRQQFSKAYPTTKIDQAFATVYEDPVGAILKLANL